jgi:hypothetical protein
VSANRRRHASTLCQELGARKNRRKKSRTPDSQKGTGPPTGVFLFAEKPNDNPHPDKKFEITRLHRWQLSNSVTRECTFAQEAFPIAPAVCLYENVSWSMSSDSRRFSRRQSQVRQTVLLAYHQRLLPLEFRALDERVHLSVSRLRREHHTKPAAHPFIFDPHLAEEGQHLPVEIAFVDSGSRMSLGEKVYSPMGSNFGELDNDGYRWNSISACLRPRFAGLVALVLADERCQWLVVQDIVHDSQRKKKIENLLACW